MKVLVVGQGGREHVLVWKLAQSPGVEQVFCAPGNAGTARDGENVDIDSADIARLLEFAKGQSIDLTVVGPEAPLVDGIVDAFEGAGLCVFGPSRAAAQLEGSKTFSKELMRKANVPTADFCSFEDAEDARAYIKDRDETPLVVKADGLAAGKGVYVCSGRQEALQAVEEIMVDQAFGEAGATVIIEECLVGEEASILAICDGQTIVPLEASQDHKRAFDGDQGPNTGGMGAYSPAPLVTPKLMDEIVERVLVPTVHAMRCDDSSFCGILYAGLMITNQGPK
ncbi:MAG: phosphoribosylamine--glycine ligase, partial [Planctomycetaceae bacterium]|nr:phosphoribosylamine--glycine ligase [Planctomycetaceae bacterium]